MDKIKKAIFFSIPVSICNFRCSYCYLAQRDEHYQGKQIKWRVTPEEFRKAFSKERIGGPAYFNFCADGETLLVKDIDKYVKALLEEGHYVEFITNASITSSLDKFLTWDKGLLSHLEFKCSFHYLQLKNKNLLKAYADNIHKIWNAGASACVELVPTDDLVPYLDEIKDFAIKEFGALPHLTIARNDRTRRIEYLTDFSLSEYDKTWSTFKSPFWEYKKSIFKKKQKQFCYAGKWSLYINIETGTARQCYCGRILGNVYDCIDDPLPEYPVGKCSLPHCYNGHAFLTMGLIPNVSTDVFYGCIRNRTRQDGFNWLQKEFLDFANTKLKDSNAELSERERKRVLHQNRMRAIGEFPKLAKHKLKKLFRRNN